jgi:hypothetical protein
MALVGGRYLNIDLGECDGVDVMTAPVNQEALALLTCSPHDLAELGSGPQGGDDLVLTFRCFFNGKALQRTD